MTGVSNFHTQRSTAASLLWRITYASQIGTLYDIMGDIHDIMEWRLPPGLVFSACGGTSSGGRVGLRLELAWLGRAETPC